MNVEVVSCPRIGVAICTYQRNGPLLALLNALLLNAAYVGNRAMVGVVVVDDSSDGQARSVVEDFEGVFQLGLHYRFSGKQNISLARNLAIGTACAFSDWTAMIDDDCEPVLEWLDALIRTQQAYQADAVTGTMVRRVPPGSPKWLTEQPFLQLGLTEFKDGQDLTFAATFNSMISSRWLLEHPEIRFRDSLGVIGGEDMVFYRSAYANGLRIVYSTEAYVYEHQPPSRATFAYQLRSHFWHGNSSYVTSIAAGSKPFRFFVHASSSMTKALVRPFLRIAQGQKPQFRYCIALLCHAFGKMIGVLGVRVRH